MKRMAVLKLVRVPERGHVDIDAPTWRTLSGDPTFWKLVQQGMLGVSLPRRGQVRLDGSCYVGRAMIGDVTLEMIEKIPGALPALLGFATHRAFRVEELAAPASELGSLAALLVHQFLEGVRGYASRGRDFQYSTERCIGSLAGGRIDMTRTLRLRARGLRHLVAFDRPTLMRSTSKNRVLLAAIHEVERMSRLIDLSPGDIVGARALALLFADCRDSEVLFGRRDRLVHYAEQLAEDPRQHQDRDLLALSGVILARESFEPSGPSGGSVPRAWFLNLEALFETAVRRVLRGLVARGITVAKGSRIAPPIFEREVHEFRAHPDLVVGSGVKVTAVGDVKYKEWSGAADEADLYQLLIHAATFKAEDCFLVFPHNSFQARELGAASTGCRTWLFAVDIQALYASLQDALVTMALPVRVKAQRGRRRTTKAAAGTIP